LPDLMLNILDNNPIKKNILVDKFLR